MANGTYGIVRPADVDINDIEAFYTYSPNRTTQATIIQQLNPQEILTKIDHPTQVNRILGGLYNLRLPTTTFSDIGIYNIYIRPKEIKLRIRDCGVLAINNDIKGLIFDLNDVPAEDLFRFENNGLMGYRIEYMSVNPNLSERKIQNLFRIITSNFRVEPITDNLNSANQKSIKYRLNDNSSLIFCTLTPSSVSTINPNFFPFIGLPNQEIILTNTYFDPLMLEIDMVQYDENSIAIGVFGNQVKNIGNGIRTIYDENNQIYRQYNEFVIKDNFTGQDLYEVKQNRDNIDFSEAFDNVTE
jgi:hypothetical protein